MIEIKLKKAVWQYDPQKRLGKEGGFGAVFEGLDCNGNDVAVKKMTLGAGGSPHRELDIAESLFDAKLNYVIPILDAGIDPESGDSFIVMAVAEKNLAEELNGHERLSTKESVTIAKQIVNGLIEVIHIVHRDLKPANILSHNGSWKLGDFGISRFVDASTSLNTLNDFCTAQYAAPEQWRGEHVKEKTDIYALGCILYEMLTGSPPFPGSRAELQRQHLQDAPPVMPKVESGMRGLVSSMLLKNPGSRPDLERVLDRLDSLQEDKPQRNSIMKLQDAVAKVSENRAIKEANLETRRMEEENRRELAKEGISILQDLNTQLIKRISANVPDAEIESGGRDVKYNLGRLMFNMAQSTEYFQKEVCIHSKWDVVTSGKIAVAQRGSKSYNWSSTLIYAKPNNDNQFRWWEISLMTINTSEMVDTRNEPFAAKNISEIAFVLSLAQGTMQLATPPRPIDNEDFESFAEDWIDRFAKAINGELTKPRYLPLTT